MILRLGIFLLINFGALALGSLFTSKGVSSDWYTGLNKAPWTPPGWVFGAAWTSIMILFSIYLAYLWPLANHKNILMGLFVLQFCLNVLWNPVFFHFQYTQLALLLIISLTLLVGFMMYYYWPDLKHLTWLLLPYFMWLMIASSLNGYVVFKN